MTYDDNQPLVDESLNENGNGWKLDLFLTIDEDYICIECQNISKDAVSLVCKTNNNRDIHSDRDISLYCESCMKNAIKNNARKCPITNHPKPTYASARLPRKKIMEAIVLCPNSVEYQRKLNNNVPGCSFEGPLESLINEHIHGCTVQNKNIENNKNESQMHLILIRDLQEKNGQTEEQMHALKDENAQMKHKMEEMDNNFMGLLQRISVLEKLQEQMQNEMKSNADTNQNKSQGKSKKNKNQKKRKKNRKSFGNRAVVEIPLVFHSCRKVHLEKCHPRNLLVSGTDNYYGSAPNSDFGDSEKDWVIFEITGEQFFLPTLVKILNYDYMSGIACMEAFIGSVDDGEWHKLNAGGVRVEKQEDSFQEFDLGGHKSLVAMAEKNSWKFIRVSFTENYGMSDGQSCKFICHELQFHGKLV